MVYRTIAEIVFWEFDSIIMQNLSNILPLFCTPTWPSHHVSENQEYGLCVLTNWLLPDFYLSHILVLKGKRWFWDDRLTICLSLPQRHFWALSDVLLVFAIATRVFHYSDLKQENQRESKEAKRSVLPRLPQPYALLPTTTPRKPKTQYEALAWKRRTDQGTKELPPKRSTPGGFCLPTLQAFQTDLGSVDRKPIDQLTRH